MIQSIYLIAGDNGFVRRSTCWQLPHALAAPHSLPRTPPQPHPRSDVLLEKHYKGIINRSAVETFWEEVSKRSKRDVSEKMPGAPVAPCVP